MQRCLDRSHDLHELLVDDADQLLRGVNRVQNPLSQRLFGDPIHEIANDRNAGIRLQQRLFDQLEAVAHIALAELPLALQGFQR